MLRKVLKMRRKTSLGELVEELCLSADESGLTEFEVHGHVKDGFREIHKTYMRRLGKQWDAEFERLRKSRREQSGPCDVQDTGGEIMPKPLKQFAASNSIRAVIWENKHENGDQKFTTHTVRVERRYKDRDGNWQSTNGFGKNDLPKLALVVGKAFEFLTMRGRGPQDEENGEDPEA